MPRGGPREVEIDVPIGGTLDQIIDFLRGLERHESFVRVNWFKLQPHAGRYPEVGPLRLDLSISTYRFDETDGRRRVW